MLAFLRTTCLLIVFVFTLGSQLTGSATIPADRMAVAYQLYSRLVPFGEAARPDWPHDLLLIEDSTITIVPPDRKCDDPQIELNPHVAVQPTRDRRQDYEEILQDFDRHCHDRIILGRSGFKLSHQFRLLGANEQKEFEEYRSNRAQAHDSAIAAKYTGAGALFAFSEVYLNGHHTVALLYATDWCGSLCGHGLWLAFALDHGQWKSLNWNSSFWIS